MVPHEAEKMATGQVEAVVSAEEREARELLHVELQTWRVRPHRELVAFIGTENHWEKSGSNGRRFGLEVVVVWDGSHGGPVRVIGSVDDGGLRAWAPWTETFVKAPDGSFVGE